MRKPIIIVAIIAAVAAAAYGYYRYTRKPPAPSVSTARITRGDVVESVAATGQLQAVTTVQVGTQVSGTIQALYADFNSLVRKGQVLARLDPSLFQTQIEQARANLIRAQADLERLRVSLEDARTKLNRARELWDKKLIAQTELEAAEVAVRSAEAQLRSQQAAVTQSEASLRQNEVNLQHTVIESPIDGLVISRNVDVGQTVAASMSAPTLFVLAADLTQMQVLASLDESDVGRIRPGQPVRFRVDAFATEEFGGSVTQVRLQPTTVQNVVTYQTVIDVPNPELKLKPGMTANVNIEIARRSNVLRVPNTALRFRPTTEMFEALGQTPPPAGGERGRGGGTQLDTRMEAPASQRVGAANPTPAQAQPLSRTPSANIIGGGGRRGNFAERLAGMTPEQRAEAMERMRARGITPPTYEQIAAATSAVPTRGQGPAGGAARSQEAQATRGQAPQSPAEKGATTFDALFGPLPPTESFGQVWLRQEGMLQRVRLRIGITDGQQTELIQALDGTLQEGAEVVTNIIIGAGRQTATPRGGNAFPGLGGPQIFRGPGGGRGGG